MRGRGFHYIDLFDSYRAMDISRSELALKMQAYFPRMELDSELRKYNEALEYLRLHELRHSIQNICKTEPMTKASQPGKFQTTSRFKSARTKSGSSGNCSYLIRSLVLCFEAGQKQ